MAIAHDTLMELGTSVSAEVVELRRDIHANPELGLQNPRTQSCVLDALDGMGLHITTGDAVSSVVADLDTGQPGPTLLLRADTDALPMTEDTDEPFKSTVEDRAHACGHDAHTAMLVGAARVLAEQRSEFRGRIRFMFQPGEEGHHGARYMIDEGVLDGVDQAFALHITPNIPAGYLASRPGSVMASADTFHLTVSGAGGHASTPHFCTDPIPAACEIVPALQTMVTRSIDAFDPAVVSVTHIDAGTTTNVIPESALVEGTIRAVSERTRTLAHEGIERVATGVAEAHGCSCTAEIVPGYPVTINHAADVAHLESVIDSTLGASRYFEFPNPVMGAEDFSYVLQHRPGAMAFLGVCPADIADSLSAAPCHSNRMRLNEDAMDVGVAIHLGLALSNGTAAS
jgi:hippurate hydrolase